jgi:hypothetical protein
VVAYEGEISEFTSVGPEDTPGGSRDFLCAVLCLSMDFHIGIGTAPKGYTTNEIYGGWFDNRGFDTPAAGFTHSSAGDTNVFTLSWGPSIPSSYNIPTYSIGKPIWPPPPAIANNQ